MKKLSKEKRTQLVLVLLATVGVLVGLWFLLINSQKQKLQSLADAKKAAEHKLQVVKQAIANADQVEVQLTDYSQRLAAIESGMAAGDLYSWAINTIRQFKLSYKVEIPQFSQIDGPKEVTMLCKFPYKQASLTISGTAAFNDLGKFISDFENQFPYVRVLNLTLEPAPAVTGGEREKLAFRLELAALIKPTSSL